MPPHTTEIWYATMLPVWQTGKPKFHMPHTTGPTCRAFNCRDRRTRTKCKLVTFKTGRPLLFAPKKAPWKLRAILWVCREQLHGRMLTNGTPQLSGTNDCVLTHMNCCCCYKWLSLWKPTSEWSCVSRDNYWVVGFICATNDCLLTCMNCLFCSQKVLSKVPGGLCSKIQGSHTDGSRSQIFLPSLRTKSISEPEKSPCPSTWSQNPKYRPQSEHSWIVLNLQSYIQYLWCQLCSNREANFGCKNFRQIYGVLECSVFIVLFCKSKNHRSLLQNIVSFIGLFCKRDL